METGYASMEMAETRKKKNYQAPALEKGLDILEHLSSQGEGRTQVEIAQALGRNQSEIYRMLTCLEARGYIAKEPGGGGYRMTLRLFELGHRQHTATLLRQAAHLPMEALAEEIGQSCHLSFPHGISLIVMMERMPARRVCLAVGEGAVLPLSRTASGKVLLGRMPDAVAERILAMDPDYKQLSPALRNQMGLSIAAARTNGFLAEESDLTEGVADIAVPVGVDGSGTAAVLAVSYLNSGKDAAQRQRRYLGAAQLCAAEINRNLGVFR